MKVLIGSKALSKHFKDFYREVNDVDYFSDTSIDGAESFYHPNLEQWAWGEIATINELYTIKVSHAFWALRNNSWNKHMQDIVFLQGKNAEFIPELYAILYPIWEEIHGKKKANLEQEPDQFFNPNVDRKYEHDTVHASIAYYDEPLFNEILRDDHAVAVDKSKFDVMPLEKKFQLAREEFYATALERHLIPNNYRKNKTWAYRTAAMQTITSFSKGWFPLFIVLHWSELRNPDVDFVKVHHENSHKLVLMNK